MRCCWRCKFNVFDPRTLTHRGPPLEVVLVNAKSNAKPTQADVLAQANLDGGGNTDADRRAKTPLPVPRAAEPGQRHRRHHAEGRGAGAAGAGADHRA